MHVIGNNAPKTLRIILAHLHITIDNQLRATACSYTNRCICRIGSDIQIAVHCNLTATCSHKTTYSIISIRFSICLI